MLKEEKKNNKIDGVQTFWWIDGDVFSPATSCPYKFPDQAESSCYGCTVLRKRFTGQKAGTRARESIKNTRFNQLICSFFFSYFCLHPFQTFILCANESRKSLINNVKWCAHLSTYGMRMTLKFRTWIEQKKKVIILKPSERLCCSAAICWHCTGALSNCLLHVYKALTRAVQRSNVLQKEKHFLCS